MVAGWTVASLQGSDTSRLQGARQRELNIPCEGQAKQRAEGRGGWQDLRRKPLQGFLLFTIAKRAPLLVGLSGMIFSSHDSTSTIDLGQ